MSDTYELTHPTGKFIVKVSAERREILLSRGYRDANGPAAPHAFAAPKLPPAPRPAQKPRKPKARR